LTFCLAGDRTTRLSTLPDLLWIQLRKFTLAEDWTPRKLDVAVEIPTTLDLAWMMSGGGPQPGEVVMVDDSTGTPGPSFYALEFGRVLPSFT